MSSLNKFDKISSVYDILARIVFGKSIVTAQLHFVKHISARAKVLILGGGTGWLLREVLHTKPDCEVWYIEASAEMIALSKNKINDEGRRVHFIHGSENDIPAHIYFDVVITNFYFDLFQQQDLDAAIQRISNSTKYKTQWLVTDFLNGGKQWQKLLLALMYAFFKYTCNVMTGSLPNWKKSLLLKGFTIKESQKFYNGFIESAYLL